MTKAEAQVYRQGQRRLRALLPVVRAEARKSASLGTFRMVSGIAQAQAAHITEDNLDALLIYPGERGGWHADLVLKSVPTGIANTLGTPVEEPMPTEAAAEERGRALLFTVLGQIQLGLLPADTSCPPVFQLDGYEVALHPIMFRKLRELAPGSYETIYGSHEGAVARVAAVREELCPGGFNGGADLSDEQWARLATVLHLAAVRGVLRYPVLQPGAPRTHDAPARTQ